jgi:hypothetical protein
MAVTAPPRRVVTSAIAALAVAGALSAAAVAVVAQPAAPFPQQPPQQPPDAAETTLRADLSFTPATNLLAIRRMRPAIGQRVAVRAAWLDFPLIALQPLEQIYERLTDTSWRYESGGGTFTARLETGAAGFVTEYPGLWQRES